MLCEIRSRARRTVCCEIGGRGAQGHAAGREPPRHQARIAQIADADGEVPALLGKVDLAIIQAQLDRDMRMEAGKFREAWRDLAHAEYQGHVEAKQPARLKAIGCDGGLGGLDLSQNALAGFQIAAPGIG